jgi:hypothetical protein
MWNKERKQEPSMRKGVGNFQGQVDDKDGSDDHRPGLFGFLRSQAPSGSAKRRWEASILLIMFILFWFPFF